MTYFNSMRRDLQVAAGLFLLLSVVYILSPNATPFDSRWTVHTALSIIHERDTNLDEYLPLLERDRFYAIECLASTGERIYPVLSREQCRSGHYYNFYPVGVALLAAPEVLALEMVLRAGQPWLRPLSERMPTEVRKRFLQADLAGASILVELLVASLLVALAAALMYLTARTALPIPWAVLLALIFGLCTTSWSISSRALWQHGPSTLLLAAALLLFSRAAASPRLVRYAGIPLAAAFFVRPTNVVPLAVFTLLVLLHYRRHLAGYLLWMAPVALVQIAINLSDYGTVLAPYAFVSRPNAPGLWLHPEFAAALAGNLIAPARGLFVYCPVFLFCFAGVLLARRAAQAVKIEYYAAAALVLHWILISLYADWWGGHTYGPRYFADVMPLLVYLLIPVAALFARDGLRRRWAPALCFFLLTAVGGVLHEQGAFNWATIEWNVTPSDIRASPWRIWDWQDPPFLRGFRQ